MAMTAPRTIIDGAHALRPAAIETLALAFASDPALSWIIPDPVRRARRLPGLFEYLFDDHQRRGLILTSPAREVVTLWHVPGGIHVHQPLTLGYLLRMLAILGPNIRRAGTAAQAIADHIPAGEDHLYLNFIGVHPAAQGKGWGGLAIRAGIAEANRRGIDVCLETATPVNVGIYQRMGFAVTDEWDVPGGGPHFWTMVRPCDSVERSRTG